MNRLLTCLFVVSTSLLGPDLSGAEFKINHQTFTVPDGFEVELVAGPPLMQRPISASFDETGRLYVTDSSGSNDKVEKQVVEKPHRVMRLDPADEQGRFTNSVVFAEHLMFPEGCLWLDGSLYVSAPPSIWKLTDSQALGQADLRSEWHQGKTLTGCANDLHGPYLGLDGWVYWCKGAFAFQSYGRPGGKPFTTRASHVFRAPPDHSFLEPVLTCGMDNPVGVVFTLSGEPFMCGTFLMHPEAGKRDGVVHAVYGGMYGKSNDVLDDHPKTGELLPIMTHLGAAAPCSILRYESGTFGDAFRDNLFVCCFNLHKITRHELRIKGATFATRDSDFLVSDNPDFHPTDVLEDADGSLLVIDTGGWYKLCCPTSQLSKPDVLGAIYRVRRTGTAAPNDARGLALDWQSMNAAQAAMLLQDSRPAVRKRALGQFTKLGVSAVPALKQALAAGKPENRAEAVWALTRIADVPARNAVRTALQDSSDLVRQAAAHSAGLWRDRSASVDLLALLNQNNPQVQRAAAEALGRIGDPGAVPALLQAAANTQDRFLQHSLIYALIEISAPNETAQGLKAQSHAEIEAALVALDQMPGGNLDGKTISPWLASTDPELRRTCLWVAAHHPEWGADLADFFRQQFESPSLVAEDLERQLALFSKAKPVQELIGTSLKKPELSKQARQWLLRAIARSSPSEVPSAWAEGVKASLEQPDELVERDAIAAAKALTGSKSGSAELETALTKLAQDPSRSSEARVAALAALPGERKELAPDLMDLLVSTLNPSRPVVERTMAAGVLAKARLTDNQLNLVAQTLTNAGPLEMTKLLECFEQSTSATVGQALVESLKQCRSRSSIRPDALERVLAKYPAEVQQSAQALLSSLNSDLPTQRAHLDEVLASLGKGDIRRGQAVFNSQKAACSSCHSMGYLGGHVGPDLTSIGQVRTEKDLLESILYPSASFVRSFEPYLVRTKADEQYNGVLRKDGPDEVVLATGPDTEVRLARSDIIDMRPGTVSVMPAGLEQQLSRQELADLVAFLKATKWGAQ